MRFFTQGQSARTRRFSEQSEWERGLHPTASHQRYTHRTQHATKRLSGEKEAKGEKLVQTITASLFSLLLIHYWCWSNWIALIVSEASSISPARSQAMVQGPILFITSVHPLPPGHSTRPGAWFSGVCACFNLARRFYRARTPPKLRAAANLVARIHTHRRAQHGATTFICTHARWYANDRQL